MKIRIFTFKTEEDIRSYDRKVNVDLGDDAVAFDPYVFLLGRLKPVEIDSTKVEIEADQSTLKHYQH